MSGTALAHDRKLDRRVALQEYLPRDFGTRQGDGTVGPRSSSDAEDYQWGLARFLEEARTLARLDHARVARVYQVLEARGTAYMVTEYVEGGNLEEELQADGPWPEVRVRALLEALLPGLAAVHRADLVHRDIKPANIMLRSDGVTPVLIDFGAARYAAGVHSRSLTSVLTPGYAPHEQYQTAGKQGPWTDVYALGAVAYRALSGRVPVEATARVDAIARAARVDAPAGVGHDPDPLVPVAAATAGEVSDACRAAVTAALAVWPEDRPQDVAAWRAQWDGGQAVGPPVGSAAEAGKDDLRVRGGAARPGFTGGAGSGVETGDPSGSRKPWIRRAFHRTAYAVTALVVVAAVTAGIMNWSGGGNGGAGGSETANVTGPEPGSATGRDDDQSGSDLVFSDCDGCPELVSIPAGTFMMGSPASEPDREDDEGPVRRVTVGAFALGRTEVTRAEYAAFVAATGHGSGGGCMGGWREPGFVQGGDHPVVCVSWEDAQAYVAWLSRETGESYRLPSESEWEYAARAGTTTARYWGGRVG